MRALLRFITALAVPLALLDGLGGFVSGIWLAVLGAWSTIGLGILFFIGSTTALSFVLLPGLLLTALATKLTENGKTFGAHCIGVLDCLYTLTVVTAWCCGVLFFFVKDATSSSLIPKLIWSYGVAVGPSAYMASKEQHGQEGLYSTLTTFFAESAYLAIILMILFSPVTLVQAVKVFSAFMLVALAIEMVIAHLIQKEMRESVRLGL